MAVPEGSPTYEPGVSWDAVTRFRPTGGSYGTPVAEGAGFKFDEATLHELVKEWTDLAKEYTTDRYEAQLIAISMPPGREYASEGNAEVTRESGKALMDALDARSAYCAAMADKYRTALGKYATAEDGATSAINQQPKGLV